MGQSGQGAPIIVIGAGMSGLVATLELARRGVPVILLEARQAVGGKIDGAQIGQRRLDIGPTVLTMRWVFDEIFAAAGSSFATELAPAALHTLARHFWRDGTQLDLTTCAATNANAIGELAGAHEARGYRAYHAYAERLYQTVLEPFILGSKPNIRQLLTHHGVAGMLKLTRIDAFRPMMAALQDYFRDPRLLQLFGRYATYCGGSPYETPATLNLVAAVEHQGVWRLPGGMQSLSESLVNLAIAHGAQVHCRSAVQTLLLDGKRVRGVQLHDGTQLPAQAVILAAGAEALPELLGQPPPPAAGGLSAYTWAMVAQARGLPLAHHSVFFSDDYADEFNAIFKHQRVPTQPTVYVCAMDRTDAGDLSCHSLGDERLFCLINAPQSAEEFASCQQNMLAQLHRCGLMLQPVRPPLCSTPKQFAQRFAASQGALYGPPPHSWRSFFARPGSRSSQPGLYLCGGSVHPGPGLPMTALSGRLAATALCADFNLAPICRPVAMPGGTSMPKATTAGRP